VSEPTVDGPAVDGPAVWSGRWVRERVGVQVETTAAPIGVSIEELVGLAVRRNPRRIQLLVSRVLGKHVPTDPRLVQAAGRLLGLLVAESLGTLAAGTAATLGPALRAALAEPETGSACRRLRDRTLDVTPQPWDGLVVLGNAETATALGHSVAGTLPGARYLHSTRRPASTPDPIGGFAEPHSHADQHLLQPDDTDFLAGPAPLVIVDDELSSGVTALNTVAALQERWPRDRYLIASLIDMRAPADVDRVAQVARQLRVRIDVVSLAAGRLRLAEDSAQRAARLIAELAPPPGSLSSTEASPEWVPPLTLRWPPSAGDGARHGLGPNQLAELDQAWGGLADQLVGELSAGTRAVQVLGTEEFMYPPLRLAEALADRLEIPVRFSTTTRSPVVAVDEPGYAIRTALSFGAHDDPSDGPGPRYCYNLRAQPGLAIVVVTDSGADTARLRTGLLAELSALLQPVGGQLLLAAAPARDGRPAPLRGPDFGSYQPAEVGWLLTDLSAVSLEAPTEEREEAIQAGGAHYAESLPIEYQPSPQYRALYEQALDEAGDRVAEAVGVLTELVLATRAQPPVLVSLARAGTPIGVLMRRWAGWAHGLDLPHYAVSIVRGRGIDRVALSYLAEHEDPSRILFVDGWTGKGAITRELAAAVAAANAELGTDFDPEPAVLADPGRCVRRYGTREDFLIPSACLNSTVSGLVSRTVLNDELIGPNDYHGAKFYAELAGSDVSAQFLDAISGRFAGVAAAVAAQWPTLASSDRTPTWAGWQAIEALSAEYEINDPNLVKPGVGETTRVLLRRVPWKVLVRPGADLPHIRLLAEQRGVPVEVAPGLPYACVGLIHPRFTRGATDSTGRSAGVRA
jgi:hypothetical protein